MGKLNSEGRDQREQERDRLLTDMESRAAARSRSSRWKRVREEHLHKYPTCECCGGDDQLEVHHIMPFHLYPELELKPFNLLTLCCAGPAGVDCHLFVGHCGNWKSYNHDVKINAASIRTMLINRVGKWEDPCPNRTP